MCDLELNTQADTKAWLLENHPDKGGQVDVDTMTDVLTCYKQRSFCVGGNPPDPPLGVSPPNRGESRTQNRGESRTQNRGESRTQNRGESSTQNRGDSRTQNRGNSSTQNRGDSSTQNRGDSSTQNRGDSSTQNRGESSPERGVRGAAPLNKKKRDKIFTCMRQTENWSKILPEYKLDNKKFDPEAVKLAIHNASPKLEQLFRIIEQVDANDMRTHGHYFKHFIFSDVKEEGYGAKILASAFIANGYKNLITARAIPGQKALKLTLLPTGADGEDKAFGLLSSSALFNSEFNQKFKKEVLTMYNKRPDNIQGENMRFIILDSGFKEGIDLFDVKYVHIFEPSLTVADLKQTIGRATRTCGQKGLNFEPNVGWPLFVYNYYIAVPDEIKELYEAADPSLLQYPEEDKKIFQNAAKLKDAAILYSNFDKTLTNLAEQLYKLAPIFSVDFELTENIHRIADMAYLYEQQNAQTASPVSASIGGAPPTVQCKGKCGLRSTKDIPATVDFLYKVYVKYGHPKQNVPAKHPRAYLCGYMKNHPTYCEQVNKEWANRAAFVPYLYEKKTSQSQSAKQSKSAKQSQSAKPIRTVNFKTVKQNTRKKRESNKNAYLEIKTNKAPSYMEFNKNSATPYLEVGPIKPPSYLEVGPIKPPSYMEVKQNSATPYLEISSKRSSSKRSSSKRSSSKRSSSKRSSSKRSSSKRSSSKRSSSKRSSSKRKSSPIQIASEVMQQLELVPYVAPTAELDYTIVDYDGKSDPKLKQNKPGPPPKKLSFQKMRDFIKTNYVKNFTWGEIVVENKCVEPKAQPPAPAQQAGGASRIMSLNPTQDFVRTFFTPQSPYKGLLLFQSVGTGKTCTAIATATSSFEQEGYTILWVTRTTLKSDVYKNMFDDVCHLVLAEKMKQGLIMPEDLTRRKKLLSKNWIEPISYKTFSNLLTPGAHNAYMDKLIQRNGATDILKKTLIIIDEAHKLYGGDLKAGERPDMAVMERLLQKSYDISGKDSARLLIMTATPFTNSPMELFQLINLCKETPSEKITTELAEFKRQYMNADALLTDAGVKKLADKLSGYISYLNREQDPTQFAQPIMIEVPVIMSHLPDNEVRKELFSETDKNVNKLNNLEAKVLSKQQETAIREMNKTLRETQKNLKALLKERQTRCKTIKNRADKAQCMQEIKNEVEAEIRGTVENIKVEIERLKKSQEENKGLKANEKEHIKQMKERLETLRKDLLQEVMLSERCKNIKLI